MKFTDLEHHTSNSRSGTRSPVTGARLSFMGPDRGTLRIAMRPDAEVGDYAAISYSAKAKAIVVHDGSSGGSPLKVRRAVNEGRRSYPVILVNMKSGLRFSAATPYATDTDCKLVDGKLVIPLPAGMERVGPDQLTSVNAATTKRRAMKPED